MSTSKLLFPIYCVPPPNVDSDPDFTSTLLTPKPSFTLSPGNNASISTVSSAFLSDPVPISKPPIVPPSNRALEPVISPLDFSNNPLELIDVESNVKPPITPPVKSTCDPVISPVDLNIKLFPVSLIEVVPNSKPPTDPPVKSTAEPVISPVDFTLNGALPLASNVVAPAKNLVSPIDDKPDTLLSVVL